MAVEAYRALQKRKKKSSLSWSLQTIHQRKHESKIIFPRRTRPNPTNCSLGISWRRTGTSLHLAQNHFLWHILGGPSGPICCRYNNSSLLFRWRNNRSALLFSPYRSPEHRKGKGVFFFGRSECKNEANLWCIWEIFGLARIKEIPDKRCKRMVELFKIKLRLNNLRSVEALLWFRKLACLVHPITQRVSDALRC